MCFRSSMQWAAASTSPGFHCSGTYSWVFPSDVPSELAGVKAWRRESKPKVLGPWGGPAPLVCPLPSLWSVLSAQNFSSTFGLPLGISPLACSRVPPDCTPLNPSFHSLSFIPAGWRAFMLQALGWQSPDGRWWPTVWLCGESDSRVLCVA